MRSNNLFSPSYGSKKKLFCLFRRHTDAFNSLSWRLGMRGNRRQPFKCCCAKIYANVFIAEPSSCQCACAHTCTVLSACRRSLLRKHTMKSQTLAAHLHDIIAEVLEICLLTSCCTSALFACFFFCLLEKHGSWKRHLAGAVFLELRYSLRDINGANLSTRQSCEPLRGQRSPLYPPRPLPDVTQPNESAQILTISCASLLWISAIIAPHVDMPSRSD